MEINIANDNAYRIQFDLGKGGGKRMGGYKHMYLLIYVVRPYLWITAENGEEIKKLGK